MNRFCCLYLLMTLTACSTGEISLFSLSQESLDIDIIEINFFPERNIFYISGHNLFFSNKLNKNYVKKTMENDLFCPSIKTLNKKHYGRFFIDDSSRFSVECFYNIASKDMLSFSKYIENIYEETLSQFFHRSFYTQRRDDTLFVMYNGSKLNIKEGAFNHQQLNNIVVGLYENKKFVKYLDSNKESIFLFYIVLNKPLVSLAIQTNRKIFNNDHFFLFEDLPIESNQYKELSNLP